MTDIIDTTPLSKEAKLKKSIVRAIKGLRYPASALAFALSCGFVAVLASGSVHTVYSAVVGVPPAIAGAIVWYILNAGLWTLAIILVIVTFAIMATIWGGGDNKQPTSNKRSDPW